MPHRSQADNGLRHAAAETATIKIFINSRVLRQPQSGPQVWKTKREPARDYRANDSNDLPRSSLGGGTGGGARRGWRVHRMGHSRNPSAQQRRRPRASRRIQTCSFDAKTRFSFPFACPWRLLQSRAGCLPSNVRSTRGGQRRSCAGYRPAWGPGNGLENQPMALRSP